MKRAAVTGANGFIGSHLVEYLSAAGSPFLPVGLCRQGSGRSNLSWARCSTPDGTEGEEGSPELELRWADVLKPESLAPAFDGCAVVFHVAGVTKPRRPEDLTRVNVDGTAAVMEAAVEAGVERVVLVSSQTAVGPAPVQDAASEDRIPRPVSSYGRSKRAGELVAWTWADRVPLTIVRPPTVYGPRDTDMLENMKVGKKGLVFKPGLGAERIFSLIHVRDLVRAFVLAASHDDVVDPKEDGQRPSGQGIFHVDDGAPISWTDLSILQSTLQGKKPKVIALPIWVQYLAAMGSELGGKIQGNPPIFTRDKVRESKQVGWVFDISRAREVLGYSPEVGLEQGTRETIAWYRERGLL